MLASAALVGTTWYTARSASRSPQVVALPNSPQVTAQVAASAKPLDLARPEVARAHRIDVVRQTRIAHVSKDLADRSEKIMAKAIQRWTAKGGYAGGALPDFRNPGTLCARELAAARASAERQVVEMLTPDERNELVTSLPLRKQMMLQSVPIAAPMQAPVAADAHTAGTAVSGASETPQPLG